MFSAALSVVFSMFRKNKPMIIGLVLVLLVGGSFYGGWKVHEYKVGYDEAQELKVQAVIQKQLDNALFNISEEIQNEISDIRIENKTIYRDTRTEILKEKVYEECLIPSEGVDLLNEARGYENEKD